MLQHPPKRSRKEHTVDTFAEFEYCFNNVLTPEELMRDHELHLLKGMVEETISGQLASKRAILPGIQGAPGKPHWLMSYVVWRIQHRAIGSGVFHNADPSQQAVVVKALATMLQRQLDLNFRFPLERLQQVRGNAYTLAAVTLFSTESACHVFVAVHPDIDFVDGINLIGDQITTAFGKLLLDAHDDE